MGEDTWLFAVGFPEAKIQEHLGICKCSFGTAWPLQAMGGALQQQCMPVGIGRLVELGTEMDQLGELGAEGHR